MKSTVKTFINKIASPYPGFTEAIRAAKTVKVKRPAPSGLYSGVNKRSQDAERLVMQGHNSLKDAKRFKDIYDVQSGARKDIAKQSLINSMTKASDSYRKAYKTNPVVARKILGRKPSDIYKPLDRGAILTAMEKVQSARSELTEKVAAVNPETTEAILTAAALGANAAASIIANNYINKAETFSDKVDRTNNAAIGLSATIPLAAIGPGMAIARQHRTGLPIDSRDKAIVAGSLAMGALAAGAGAVGKLMKREKKND